MTNEEASFILANIDRRVCDDELSDALDMAIKALEQQTCDDCISRADVKKYLSAPDANGDRVIYESDLDLLPSVTPQPKIGKWITWKEAGNEIPSETRFECSVCHDAAQTLCNGLDLLSSFCPNCGARMAEAESEGEKCR